MPDTREYFYRVDRNGRLTHDDSALTDAKFLNFFYRRIKANDTGKHADYPFVSPCGNEMNYIQCDDTPIVFTRRDDRLYYAPDMAVPFRPRDLRFSENGVLYHAAPVGEFGRLSSESMLEIGRRVEPWGPYYAYRHDDGKPDNSAQGDGQPDDTRAGENTRWTVIEPLVHEPGIEVLHSRPENECYGCGGANDAGLGLNFLYDSERRIARSWLVPGKTLQGGPGRMHGGFIALLLDEVMAKVLTGMGLSGACPTARMEVNFRRPIAIHDNIELFARLESQQGRKYRLHGEIRSVQNEIEARPAAAQQTVDRSSAGDLFAEADALYVKVMDADGTSKVPS